MYAYQESMQKFFVIHRFSYFYEINITFICRLRVSIEVHKYHENGEDKTIESLVHLLNLHNIK